MNTKKHKNKNRAKPPKIIANTQNEDTTKNLDITQQKDSAPCETLNKDEKIESIEIKCELKEEKIEPLDAKCEIKEIAQEQTTVSDVPKKPKRKKGKKKSDEWIEEKEAVLDSKEKLTEEKTDAKTENEDFIATVPARKKKNKGKKTEIGTSMEQNPVVEQSVNVSECKMELENDEKVADEVKITEVSQAEPKETTVSKKKKKKKSRHDSDKSDINDSCTLAFQKLLEPTNVENEEESSLQNPVLDQLQQDNILSDQISPSQEAVTEVLENKENLKGKRKHKKNKNIPIETETSVEKLQQNREEIICSTPDTIEVTLENVEDNIIMTELSPKPKAKIAKPVQKKRKAKSDVENLSDTADSKEEDTSTSLNELKNIEESLPAPTIGMDEEKQDDNKNATAIERPVLDKKDHKITETSDNDLLPDRETLDDNYGFVEVKTGKNKKKQMQSSKNVQEAEANTVTETSGAVNDKNKDLFEHAPDKTGLLSDVPHINIEENLKPEELEGLKVATPDLIQYPRSTSQLNIDDNNNTLIQEITVSDEIKLGIPLYVSTPIIEGSGESPEVRITEEPIKLSKSKPKINKGSNEKTDIKSKMFEVNKEMEELRRSIERSLAELTGSEACDTKVDTAFEELFQSQIKEESKLSQSCDESHGQEIKTPNETQIKENKTSFEEERRKEGIVGEVTSSNTENDNATLKMQTEKENIDNAAPVCPARSKSKGKSKKKGKKEQLQTNASTTSAVASSSSQALQSEVSKTSAKSDQKTDNNNSSTKEKGKQQSSDMKNSEKTAKNLSLDLSFEPIENFEDALTSSAEDVNKTFDIIANEATQVTDNKQYQNAPQINVIAPSEDGDDEKGKDTKTKSPVSQPKNLLGHPNIPASSNKHDFKKEKNKPPSSIQAKVKIKDCNDVEKAENQHGSQSKKLIKETNGGDAFSYMLNETENLVYKYSFRNVFLQSTCKVCKKDLIQRVPCKFCSLVFYCSQKHKDDDWPKHQSLCFAVSTISHLKDQKFIYADIQNITGHEYRLLRMQMILSCEKIMKRKLVPWEQEALLYPRMCGDIACREWKQSKLKDCEGCGQISYCIDHPEHLPPVHKQWCKSYALYEKIVKYQQTKGRVEPRLPTKVLTHYSMPDNLNEVLGSMYEEKIDMDDIHYAALTQIATAPLTTAFSYQLCSSKMNSINSNGLSKKSSFTIHSIANDVQFEADFLNKWEIFLLHLIDAQNLRVVLIGTDLNPNNLPLDIIGKIRLCENCEVNQRRVIFDFHDKQSYEDYYSSNDFTTPDIVCAFNPNIQRTSTYKIEDIWPMTLKYIFKQRVPFLLTSYTLNEIKRDINRIKECSKIDFKIMSDPKQNPFSSVRPDRNFITDHEMPLLFKNYCFSILCGV